MADPVANANAAMVDEDYETASRFYDEVCRVQSTALAVSRCMCSKLLDACNISASREAACGARPRQALLDRRF